MPAPEPEPAPEARIACECRACHDVTNKSGRAQSRCAPCSAWATTRVVSARRSRRVCEGCADYYVKALAIADWHKAPL